MVLFKFQNLRRNSQITCIQNRNRSITKAKKIFLLLKQKTSQLQLYKKNMSYPIDQSIIYRVNLPQFINNFKQQIVNMIVPHALELKAFINSERNETTVNPLIMALSVTIVLYIIKSVWDGLFTKRMDQIQLSKKQSPQLNAEVNELRKQLKALKTSFLQFTKELSQQNVPLHTEQLISVKKTNTLPSESNELWTSILPLYTLSLENNKKLVNYILESQFQMLKELKRFKKSQRASLSSGRPSTSTIRSKTSDKKISNSISKSPLKTTLNTTSSIKKPQIKISQRQIRSEITEKIQKKNEQSYIIRSQSPKNEIKLDNNHPINVVVKQRIQQIDEKNSFDKAQTKFIEKQNLIKQEYNIYPNNSNIKNVFDLKYENIEEEFSESEVTKVEEIGQSIRIESDQMGNRQGLDGGEAEAENLEVKMMMPKIPVIKKMNPPKPGGKRAPPPPPKK